MTLTSIPVFRRLNPSRRDLMETLLSLLNIYCHEYDATETRTERYLLLVISNCKL